MHSKYTSLHNKSFSAPLNSSYKGLPIGCITHFYFFDTAGLIR